jgi:hypothetical protein
MANDQWPMTRVIMLQNTANLFINTFSLCVLFYRIDKEVLLLYGFSVLRFFGDFEMCMAVENHWTERNKHPFVQRVQEATQQCGISDEVFNQWQADIIRSFKTRNAYALAIDKILDGPIESRTIIDMVHTMTNLIQSFGVKINDMSDTITSLKATINDASGNLQTIVDKKVDDVMEGFQNLNLGPGQFRKEAQQGQEQHDEDAPPEPIILSSYSNLMRTGKEMPLLDIAFYWFRYNTLQLYLNEKSRVVTKSEGSKLRQHFSAIKSTMHVVIKNLNNYPDRMPSGEPNNIVLWERSLKSQLEAALETIRPQVERLNKNNVKKLVTEYKEKEFPEGTPEEVVLFFEDQGNNQGGRRKRSADESVAEESNTNKRQRNV